MTLSELAHEWMHVYGAPNLARSTLESYAITWDRRVLPSIGGLRLRELTPRCWSDTAANSRRPASVCRRSVACW